MKWLAGEKTKVVGTFPPRKQGWTGYVEKDTAGQTNIYSVEVGSFMLLLLSSFLALFLFIFNYAIMDFKKKSVLREFIWLKDKITCKKGKIL